MCTMATKTVPKRHEPTDDEMMAFGLASEMLCEVEAIAEQMLRAESFDRYQLRTFGMRLRDLASLCSCAIDNANEASATWADLRAQLTGIDAEEASHG
jgi:hypothetical protein